MMIYKAQVVHPLTNIPLIVSFNTHTNLFSFEKDEEVIRLMKKIGEKISPNLLMAIDETTDLSICDFSYPASSLEDVYYLLEQLGIERDNVKFISEPLQ